jgi:hypothetical protein
MFDKTPRNIKIATSLGMGEAHSLKSPIFIIAIFVLGFVGLSFSKKPSSNVIVGIMEDDRQELANWKQGPSTNRVILPLFEKKGNEWIPSINHPEEIQWTITFDGKNLGMLKSLPKGKDSPYLGKAHIHVPKPRLKQELTVGKPSNDFSGWLFTAVNRPLVLVSKKNFKDPEKWRSFQPSKDQIKLFRSAFKTEYSKVINCDNDENPMPEPWQYADAAIAIASSYHSINGDLLASMYLEGGRCGVNAGPFVEQLYLFKAGKVPFHISAKSKRPDTKDSLSLTLIDTGDYDGKGDSEAIFFLSGYNEDGYAIFYDSFRKSVSWTWSYH